MPKEIINGVVNADGTIDSGTGFAVDHSGLGQYRLKFPSGTFSEDGSSALTVTQRNTETSGVNVLAPYISGQSKVADGSIVFDVRFSPVLGTSGALANTGFDFIVVGDAVR